MSACKQVQSAFSLVLRNHNLLLTFRAATSQPKTHTFNISDAVGKKVMQLPPV